MPRCGSTLLESILSLNPEVKDLGEVSFLEESLQKTDDLLEVKNLYKEKVMLINSKRKSLQIKICSIFYIVQLSINFSQMQGLFTVLEIHLIIFFQFIELIF